MISCTTSTKRRVKYPESAVRNAVSAEPLRAPWVFKKNSLTLRPSTSDEVIGTSETVPSGLAINPDIPAICPNCPTLPRAPEFIIMKIGLSLFDFAIAASSPWTLSWTPFQTSHTELCLSSSVIKPRLYCLLIFSTISWPSLRYSCLCSDTTISAIEKVIPATVENLNPKSFNLSSIILVSVVLKRLKTWAIIFCKSFLPNAGIKGILAISSGIFTPWSKKNFIGVIPSIFSFVASSKYWKASGNISLNLILPTVVTRYLSCTSSINNLCLKLLTGKAILVWRVISLLS